MPMDLVFVLYLGPNVVIKGGPIFPTVAQKPVAAVFTYKVMVSKEPKSLQIFGFLLYKPYKNRPTRWLDY